MPQEVTTTTQFPYGAVAFLVVTFPDGSRIQGTGTVVGRNDILTATHMVYDPAAGGWATDVDVYPGADYNSLRDRFDSQPLTYEDVGFRLEAYPNQVHADGSDDTLTFAESAYDVAIIGLDVAIGDVTGWFGLDTGSDAGAVAYSLGYPSTGTGMMLARPRIDREFGYQIYSSYGGRELMGPGSSGGPLYVMRNDQPYLIGVKSSGTNGESNHWADIGFTYESLILPAMARNDSLLSGTSATGPRLSITATTASLAEGGAGAVTAFHFEVVRSGDLANASTVQWSVGRAGGTGSADGIDFVGGTFPIGTLAFSAGEERRAIRIDVQGDAHAESDEGFLVTLLAPTDALIAQGSASALILNDDVDNDSGDTPGAAATLGSLGPASTLSVVERLDDDDYFRFTPIQSGLLRATLEGMTDDGDLFLLDTVGRVLASSDNPGSDDEGVSWQVNAGIAYLVRVTPFQGAQTDYTLRLALSVNDSNDAGDTLATASSLGSLQVSTPQVVSQLLDDPDYFRFYATGAGRVQITLTGMLADGDLRVYDDTSAVLAQSRASGASDESVTLDVVAGRFYTLAVEPYLGAVTSYRLTAQYQTGAADGAVPVLGLPATTITARESEGSVVVDLTRLDASSAPVTLHVRALGGTAAQGSDYALPADGLFTLTGNSGTLPIGLVNDRQIEAQEQAMLEIRRDGASGPLVGTLTLQIADDDAGTASRPPVYRYAKLASGMYFYTASESERQSIASAYPDFRFEGSVFFGETQPGPGLAPVYRYANLRNGGYFYTASEAERASIAASYPDLRFEGVAFQVPDAPAGDGLAPVYRLASLSNGAYLFTASTAERSYALSLGNWRDEGVAFNSWQSAIAGDGPFAELSANPNPEWLL
ncbi:MAG: trypsin-like serine protease [Burkholderiaceae bacterium]|nr:trypsin-like serine protease [Burkholderiaceae bacterium]